MKYSNFKTEKDIDSSFLDFSTSKSYYGLSFYGLIQKKKDQLRELSQYLFNYLHKALTAKYTQDISADYTAQIKGNYRLVRRFDLCEESYEYSFRMEYPFEKNMVFFIEARNNILSYNGEELSEIKPVSFRCGISSLKKEIYFLKYYDSAEKMIQDFHDFWVKCIPDYVVFYDDNRH